jgi:hypothetical protein
LRKTSGLADVVAEAIEPLTDRIDVAPVKETVKRLLDAAAQHIADAKVQATSPVARPR